MILCILGRQPELGLTELETLYPGKVRRFGREAALVDIDTLEVQQLGGTQKAGIVCHDIPYVDWQVIAHTIVAHYSAGADTTAKLTIGFSAYMPTVKPSQLYKLGLQIKTAVKKAGGSVRLIPNAARTLNTATSHHNKLGLHPHKKEVMIIQHGRRTLVAESIGAQNITALARRDQGRPKRDAFVGMLPPKLALMMVNIGLGMAQSSKAHPTLLDPFCGTGVVLQEAYLRGATVYGTDLSDKMIDFSQQNLAWLQKTHPHANGIVGDISQGDATSHRWNYGKTLHAVVCETYLGQPFSATPSPAKLQQVRGNCNAIIGDFLRNIHPQLTRNTPLCISIPAWRNLSSGIITRLPLVRELHKYGYSCHHTTPLLYYREDQVVARDILLLRTH